MRLDFEWNAMLILTLLLLFGLFVVPTVVGYQPRGFKHNLGSAAKQKKFHPATNVASNTWELFAAEDRGGDQTETTELNTAQVENNVKDSGGQILIGPFGPLGPYNLKDGNDWITIILSSIIAYQSIQIVIEIVTATLKK